MQYKAAMFDFDGTVTEKGEYTPTKELVDALLGLSQKMPIAFCTGRQLESFESRGFSELMKQVDSKMRRKFLENLFLFAENGAIGYLFDTVKDGFSEFYRVDWPDDFIEKNKLKKILAREIKNYGNVYDNAHRVVIVMRTKLHDIENSDMEEVYQLSKQIFEITDRILKDIAGDFERYLHVGNSGIGVIVGPADGDKDRGIIEFAKHLTDKKGIIFDKSAREILVVGDSPMPDGNDYYFLRGKYGTPFNVGAEEFEPKRLGSVFDDKGRRMIHSKASLRLINSLL